MGFPNPIPYSEMQSFFYFEQIKPLDWEINLLEAFDRVAMEAFSKQSESETTAHNSKNKNNKRK